MFTVQGARTSPDSGMFVSITGLVGLLGCVAYSFNLDYNAHRQQDDSNPIRAWIASMEHETPEWFQSLVVVLPGTLAFTICAPLALHFKSTLIAYLATMGLCQALGFSFFVYPFCYVVGFENERTMLQAGGASFMVLVIWGVARIMGMPMDLLTPFQSPVSVFGSIMLFFTLLIMSNLYYQDYPYSAGFNYFRRNGVFLLIAMVSIGVGHMYGMAGMANTGTTFLVLWVIEK